MGIFISYRRDDTEAWASHLFSDLSNRFGPSQVFMDIGDIPSGAKYKEVLGKALASCKVLLALIGPEWLDCRHEGKRRLDHPDDWVRREIATALERGVPVVPILFGRTSQPLEEQLPPELRPMLERQFAEIDDKRWDADVEALSRSLIEVAALEPADNDLTFASHGLRQLQELIRTVPAVADTVGRSREVIERTGRQVDKLEVYKTIHDAFHAIEFECLRPIQVAGVTTRLRPYKIAFSAEMRRIEDCLGRHGMNPALKEDILDQLAASRSAFEAAVTSPGEATLTALTAELSLLISGLPSRLDAGIADSAAEELDLDRLIELMRAVRDQLATGGAGPDRAPAPFIQGIDALARLRDQLSRRVAEHSYLQQLDSKLRTVCVGGTGLIAGAREWVRIKKVRARILPPYSPPLAAAHDDLTAIEAEVEEALKTSGGEPAMDLMKEYFRSVGSVFRDVDGGLKDLCARLGSASQPLETVLGLV